MRQECGIDPSTGVLHTHVHRRSDLVTSMVTVPPAGVNFTAFRAG